MNIPFNDLTWQNNLIKTEILEGITALMSESVYIGGECVEEFENVFAEYIGVKYCIGTGNCTDALELILEACGTRAGDEVIVPAYSWISSASSVIRTGATPVFVDVHPDYYTLDPSLVEAQITPNTKALIVVHFYGIPAEMKEIGAIAEKYGIRIIEDCAQAAGAAYNKGKTGSMGWAGAFSFYPTKNLGALGDGGCVTTNDKKLSDKIRVLANHGQKGKNKHKIIGRNSRLDALQAKILISKLKYLDDWNMRRVKAAARYCIRLTGNLVKLPVTPEYARHVYHLFVIQIENHYEVQGFLEQRGIQAFMHYPLPLTELEPFEHLNLRSCDFPVAKNMANRILSLPIFPGISDVQIDYVCENLKEAIAFFG
ncbi:MAG: DegT/DnrJ/EryC1/StrS family aminotransferase [Bacteroidetes bacterium]|nr:DegT/DnrJ/EryC1/StrS family aminotransferase [Bacteroidota bacterium]MCH8233425.1 DegT/DnrJ/EryC1/StrS family aminotransferase [Bacteroidota bacterium]